MAVVKLCGLRSEEDAVLMNEVQPDLSLIHILYAMLRGPYSFFLESGVLNSYGRYSIIALPCNKRLISNDGTTRLIQHGEAIQLDGNPLDIQMCIRDRYRDMKL